MEDDYIRPEPVNRLPVKRIFDFNSGKLKEVMKLPKDFELDDNEILFKIKLIGVNYKKDFGPLKSYNDLTGMIGGRIVPGSIVPCNKFVGKIYDTNDCNLEFDLDNSKYLVFPYTNCIQQACDIVCKNCTSYVSSHRSNLNMKPCLARFEMGYNIDGGLQDYIKIKNSLEVLVRIPDNVSTHDALFSLDIMLPFYSFLKNLQNTGGYNTSDKILLVLNDCGKEMNDVLVVFKILNLYERNISVVGANQISQMTTEEKGKFTGMFHMVLVFNFDAEVLDFCFKSIISTGLQSTKSRYRFVLFNQYSPIDFGDYDHFDLTDKIIVEFKLNWFHKFDLVDLLNYLSTLNNNGRRSFSSFESKSPTKSLFSENSTILDSSWSNSSAMGKADTRTSDSHEHHISGRDVAELLNLPSKIHWLYYKKDVDLSNEFQKSDNSHSTRHINKLISQDRDARICYNNKPYKSKVNAFIL